MTDTDTHPAGAFTISAPHRWAQAQMPHIEAARQRFDAAEDDGA